MKIAVFGKRHQDCNQIKLILDALFASKMEIYFEEIFKEYIDSSFNNRYETKRIDCGTMNTLDLAISVGGDGTFLRTATKIGNNPIPILGVNTGRLGFLAETPWSEFTNTLKKIEAGEYNIEKRTQLKVEINAPLELNGSNIALNEVAILKQDTASMIAVHVEIDGEFLSEYEADGLLIATPTGSTAYAMSVGGPILSPSLSSFIIVPVASHSLTSRPLLVHDHVKMRFSVSSRNDNFLLSLDGRSTTLPVETTFEIKQAPYMLKVVRLKDQSFYQTIRNKLFWGTDPRSLMQ